MDNPKPDSRRADRGRIIDVLASMALGDASREDVLAELNGHRHQSAGAALELLTRERKSRRHHRREEHHSRGPIPHPIPKIPFILNGSLYDPADIGRFDGRELHLVQTKGDYMIGIDDRSLVQMWWDLAFVESLKRKVEGIAGIHFYPPGTGKAPEDGPIKAGGYLEVMEEVAWFRSPDRVSPGRRADLWSLSEGGLTPRTTRCCMKTLISRETG